MLDFALSPFPRIPYVQYIRSIVDLHTAKLAFLNHFED